MNAEMYETVWTGATWRNYPAPQIAQEPPSERGTSRMMVLRRAGGRLEHRNVADLPEYLRDGDLLILKDTRVFPARVQGVWRDTAGALELLLLEPQPLPQGVENTALGAQVPSTPEPATWGAIAMTLSVLCVVARRRRHAAVRAHRYTS